MPLILSRVTLPVLLAATLLSSCARRPQATTTAASTAVSTPAAAPETTAPPVAQPAPVANPTPVVGDLSAAQWYLKDPRLDKVPGVGASRAYAELLNTLVPQTVIVAVIDSGIDTAHVDL